MKKNPNFDFLGPFIKLPNGKVLAVVELKVGDGANERNEQFHVYPDGTKAYEETFDYVGPFNEGRALVRKDGEEFFINYKGERV